MIKDKQRERVDRRKNSQKRKRRALLVKVAGLKVQYEYSLGSSIGIAFVSLALAWMYTPLAPLVFAPKAAICAVTSSSS